ncbi:MAG: hypothetical protein M1819_002333 [Sarea resinae]|nr:MAG: hypothetical protein M1819_002333 [Sarea resinae]
MICIRLLTTMSLCSIWFNRPPVLLYEQDPDEWHIFQCEDGLDFPMMLVDVEHWEILEPELLYRFKVLKDNGHPREELSEIVEDAQDTGDYNVFPYGKKNGEWKAAILIRGPETPLIACSALYENPRLYFHAIGLDPERADSNVLMLRERASRHKDQLTPFGHRLTTSQADIPRHGARDWDDSREGQQKDHYPLVADVIPIGAENPIWSLTQQELSAEEPSLRRSQSQLGASPQATEGVEAPESDRSRRRRGHRDEPHNPSSIRPSSPESSGSRRVPHNTNQRAHSPASHFAPVFPGSFVEDYPLEEHIAENDAQLHADYLFALELQQKERESDALTRPHGYIGEEVQISGEEPAHGPEAHLGDDEYSSSDKDDGSEVARYPKAIGVPNKSRLGDIAPAPGKTFLPPTPKRLESAHQKDDDGFPEYDPAAFESPPPSPGPSGSRQRQNNPIRNLFSDESDSEESQIENKSPFPKTSGSKKSKSGDFEFPEYGPSAFDSLSSSSSSGPAPRSRRKGKQIQVRGGRPPAVAQSATIAPAVVRPSRPAEMPSAEMVSQDVSPVAADLENPPADAPPAYDEISS